MLEKKYIIIIAIVICLFIIYYFYDELSSIKKMFIPTYQKTMSLEARVTELEKKSTTSKKSKKAEDSPPLTITYQSDAVKNGNLSVKYVDLTETEAKELVKNIDKNTAKQNIAPNKIQMGDFSDSKPALQNLSESKMPVLSNNKNKSCVSKDFEDSETIQVRMDDILQRKMNNIIKTDTPTADFQKIYDSLNIVNGISDDAFDQEIDEEIIRDISESIQYAVLPSENSVSDIPAVPKKTSQQKKSKKDKKAAAKPLAKK